MTPPWPFAELVVVPVSRPADIPTALGWMGMINARDDVVELSAVLRSWEERFGALLTGMSSSTVELAVGEPPVTEQECLRVAAEHIAFCRDAFETYTGQMYTDSLPEYAARLRGEPRWRFWWD
ncbi:DUF4253 domain-containing protein [Pseudonocardia aurantiaca]|uniref:DUF4253 domain-containing protein n=1 Tax=Pseudonocardia aurantiaca TaxID=75290 RepID=A0ABW4FNI7_9PSEU